MTSAMASSATRSRTRTTTPLRVTATGFATHVVEVRGFSKLRKKHHGDDDDDVVCSEIFTVDGLDWMVSVIPDGEGDEQGYVGVFVELVTEGVAVWAHVSIGLVDWTTGCADPFLPPSDKDGEQDPVLFDAGNVSCCNWGTGKLASWRNQLRGSRYLRRDCLRIECVVDICHFRLAFKDPPAPKFTPGDEKAVGTLGSEKGADVFIHVGCGAADDDEDDEPPIPAHSSVLDAFAPRFLKKHNLGKRQRPKTSSSSASTAGDIVQTATANAVRVDVDDMPRQAMEALLQFAYNGSLPVVNGMDGLSVDGYRDLFGHLLLAAKRYGMQTLSAICERVLCRFIDVESAAATLAMAYQHGFQKLEDSCVQFASDPENYGLVRTSEGYAEFIGASGIFSAVEWELWAKYCERSGLPYDESHEQDLILL